MKSPLALLAIIPLFQFASASIRGAIRKMRKIARIQVTEYEKPWKNLIVTNSCPMSVQSTLRFFDGNLKQIALETMVFQESTVILTDNAVTVALVAVVTHDGKDIHAADCSVNDPIYISKDDGLCYKYFFINSASSNQIDIVCDVSRLGSIEQ